MLTQFPCLPSLPFSNSDKAYLRCECVSNFGTNFITLILRHDGRLGSTAGEVADWHYEGDFIVCEIENHYPNAAPAIFAIRKSEALLRLVARNEYAGGGAR